MNKKVINKIMRKEFESACWSTNVQTGFDCVGISFRVCFFFIACRRRVKVIDVFNFFALLQGCLKCFLGEQMIIGSLRDATTGGTTLNRQNKQSPDSSEAQEYENEPVINVRAITLSVLVTLNCTMKR